MRTQLPDVTPSATGRSIIWQHIVSRITRLFGFQSFNEPVDLGDGETSQLDAEVEIALHQGLQLFAQDLLVPAGIKGKLVVGNHIGTLFLKAHGLNEQTWHLGHAQKPCCLDPAMASQDCLLIVDKDRIGEAEALDAVGNLAQLLPRVHSGIARPRAQCRNGDQFKGSLGHKGLLSGIKV